MRSRQNRLKLFSTPGAWLELRREIVIHFPETSPEYTEEGEAVPEGFMAYVDEVEEDSALISIRRPSDPEEHIFFVKLPIDVDWSSYFRLIGFAHLRLVPED